MMNWDAIGAIGEIIGAFAVVVTVAYLAIQIRNETARAKEEARRERSNRVSNTYSDLADSDHLPELFVKIGNNSPTESGWKRVSSETDLEPVEAVRYTFSRQGVLHGFQDTLLDESISASERESAQIRLRYTVLQDGPAFTALWDILGPTFRVEFREIVESTIRSVE